MHCTGQIATNEICPYRWNGKGPLTADALLGHPSSRLQWPVRASRHHVRHHGADFSFILCSQSLTQEESSSGANTNPRKTQLSTWTSCWDERPQLRKSQESISSTSEESISRNCFQLILMDVIETLSSTVPNTVPYMHETIDAPLLSLTKIYF